MLCRFKLNINILAVLLVSSLATFEPSLGFYLGRRNVNIVNRLENYELLMIHCWKNGVDLGTQKLKYAEEFKVDFVDLFAILPVKIECNMEFKDEGKPRKGRLRMYDTNKEVRRRECYRWCNWSVGVYGFYAYDEVDKVWDYEIPWPSSNKF